MNMKLEVVIVPVSESCARLPDLVEAFRRL
jgi:hypothetical protein